VFCDMFARFILHCLMLFKDSFDRTIYAVHLISLIGPPYSYRVQPTNAEDAIFLGILLNDYERSSNEKAACARCYCRHQTVFINASRSLLLHKKCVLVSESGELSIHVKAC